VTVRGALLAMGRRWYVFLAVVLAFAALTYALERDGGAFYTHTTITFTLPERPTLLPDSGTNDLSVIAFASTIATSINEGKPVATYSSAHAPYYGAGVREGVMVSLRNDGNQWMNSFPNATIDVQVVGRTWEWVADRQTAILRDIMNVTRGQQSAMTTPESDRIPAVIAPLSTELWPVTPSRSSQLLAGGAMALAASIVAATAAVTTDALVRRRRRSTARHVATPMPRLAQTGGYSA
jgi:hypothetical protein